MFGELVPEAGCDDPAAVGGLLGDCGATVPDDEFWFVELGLLELLAPGARFAMKPFCCGAPPVVGRHVIAGTAGPVFCGVPCGPGDAVVGVVSPFVPEAGA